VQDIRSYLGVDSLEYLSIEGLQSCVDDPDNYCLSCFSGDYPLVPQREFQKDVFEDTTACGTGMEEKKESQD
jgi:amidophosphoribosyltransferase